MPFTDPILEKFQKDGDAKALKAHLIELGWDIGADGKWIDHLVNMLAETRKNGIKLCGIDEETDSRRLSPDDRLARATCIGLGQFVRRWRNSPRMRSMWFSVAWVIPKIPRGTKGSRYCSAFLQLRHARLLN